MLAPRSQPIAGYADAGAIVGRALRAMRRDRVAPSENAERHRTLNNAGAYVGPWRNETAPYLVEPMDMVMDRGISTVVFVAPAQCGKSEVLLNVLGWTAMVRPLDTLLFQPTRELAIDFASRRISASLIRPSKAYRAVVSPALGDDNRFTKVWRNGARASIAWPTSANLSSRPVPLVMIDERDSMADDIAGEGDPVTLARARTRTFGSLGKVVVVTSPKRGDGSGGLALWREGDRRLWYWICPACEAAFSPGFDADRRPLDAHVEDGELEGFGGLVWPRGASIEVARREAALACPHCGGLIEETAKRGLNARGAWCADGVTLTAAGELVGDRREVSTASYWLAGVASNLARWSDLAAEYVAAREDLVERGADETYRTVINTAFGYRYAGPEEETVELDAGLVERRRDPSYRLGTVPAGALYLAAAVDVQADRFVVAVRAFDRTARSWLVDRFSILTGDDGRSPVRPAEYLEHWELVYSRVIKARYPFADDPSRGLRVGITAIDTGGLDGVTDNAYGAYVQWRRRGLGAACLMLVKGASRPDATMVPAPTVFEVGVVTQRGESKRGAVELHVLGVSKLKDVIARRLRREEFGPSYMGFPDDVPAEVGRELAGEVKVEGAWKRRGRNEQFDLEVYLAAAQIRARAHMWRPGREPWFVEPVRFSQPADDTARSVRRGSTATEAPEPAGVPVSRPTRLRRRSVSRARPGRVSLYERPMA